MGKRKLNLIFGLTITLLLLAVCFFARWTAMANVLQLVAVVGAAAICFTRATQAKELRMHRLWTGLCCAFGLWAGGQAYYVAHLLAAGAQPARPSVADLFWLCYSFPILLIAAHPHEEAEKDWTSWLDMTQAGISLVLVAVAVVLIPGSAIVDSVYDVQGFAVLFACTIRYTTVSRGAERVFFRNVTAFILSYDLVGLVLQVHEPFREAAYLRGAGWVLPFLVFCVLAMGYSKEPEAAERKRHFLLIPAHIHGVSALGLALTSIAAGILLMVHHQMAGVAGLGASFGVFALRMAVRESTLKRAQMELQHDSLHDHLTGLANRASLEEELKKARVGGAGRSFLLFLDLDRFKIINDTLGHDFGDRLLMHVAEMLRSVVRKADIVSRFGGDEFVVVLNDCDGAAMAREIAERILSKLSVPVLLDGRLIHITGSMGIAALDQSDSTLHVLHHADAAMYMAKSLGRNCVRIFDHSILDKTARDLELETDLRRSIADGSIWVAYQPIFRVETGELVGFEALARWTHPTQGAIPPDQFIPVAEETGLILQLGNQVLTRACYQVARWNRDFGTRFRVGVNVSARQLAQSDFLAEVERVLAASELDSSLLRFEITESVLLKNEQNIAEVLRSFSARGIEISLDDFGTGYSSLNYLVEFPFHTVKIDKSFLRDVDRDEQRATLMGTIVQLAKKLNKKVVAEGVETAEQLQFLADIQCDLMQGFLLSKPLAPETMAEFLRSHLEEQGDGNPLKVLIPCLKS